MIDHITIRVSDIERTTKFYTETLKPLGYTTTMKYDDPNGVRVVGFGKNGKNSTWFTTESPVSTPVHIAWVAGSKEEVNQFYKGAMKCGGKDNGAPGIRPEYGESYYAGFVIDPDGNNVEAVFRG